MEITWDADAVNLRQKKKTTSLKNNKDEFLARIGRMMGVAGEGRQAENSGKISSYEMLERRHDGTARARGVAVPQCDEETEARLSAETLALEQTDYQRTTRSA